MMDYTPVISMGNCRITIRKVNPYYELQSNNGFCAIVPFHPKNIDEIQYNISFPHGWKDTFKSYSRKEISQFQKLIIVTEIFTKGLIDNDLV